MGLEHVSAAVARVECSGSVHTLLWREGRLETPEHADPEAERALAALGGEPCRCIELLDAWEQSASDPRVLVLGPRGPRVAAPDPDNRGGSTVPRFRRRLASMSFGGSGSSVRVSGGSGRARATGAPAEPPVDPLAELLSLTGAIPHRLVSTVARSLGGRIHEPELAPLLTAALYGRVLTALSGWLGELSPLELEMIAPGAPPSLTRDGDGDALVACLPFAWLVDVWAAGLETVAGRFTLAADFDPTHGWELLTIDQTMKVNTCTLGPR